MDLVEVMGKQNKKVPVLLTPVMKAAIEKLIKHRDMCGVDPTNIYVFAKVIRSKLVWDIRTVPGWNSNCSNIAVNLMVHNVHMKYNLECLYDIQTKQNNVNIYLCKIFSNHYKMDKFATCSFNFSDIFIEILKTIEIISFF